MGFALSSCAALGLAGCDENGEFLLGQGPNAGSGTELSAVSPRGNKTVEQDKEAPDVFQVTEAGLWDGRPSLGGVWVAHPDVTDPERVIIRNEDNGKFVVGALFRRERDIPGPRLQISSDAAASLGMLAGSPSRLNVTALRREEIETEDDAVEEETVEEDVAATAASVDTAAIDTTVRDTIETAPEVDAQPLDPIDPIAAAGAAIDAVPDAPTVDVPGVDAPKRRGGLFGLFRKKQAPEELEGTATDITPDPIEVQSLDGDALASVETPAEPVAAPAPVVQPSNLKKPFLQVGIFSVENNADKAVAQLRAAGMLPTVRPGESNGKPFWRVIVGPASTRIEQNALKRTIQGVGYTDAFAVNG